MELVIRIPGEPVAQGRPRFRQWASRDGRSGVTAYDPKPSRNWKATAQQHMLEVTGRCGMFTFGEAVAVQVLAVFTCPKTDHRKRDPRLRRWHTKKPDGDNVLKAVKDAAKGVLWLDDSQVAVATIIKQIGAQGEAPYLEIRVRALDAESIPTGGDATRTPTPTPTKQEWEASRNEAPAGTVSPGPEVQPVLFKEEE